jgi:ABC-type transport system involved in multi-copper enzyme maturation permease subunit
VNELVAIVGYGLRESLRRRMFAVVLFLTLCFLGLYAFGTRQAFEDTSGFVPFGRLDLDPQVIAGAIVFGLAMFATLFLGAVLAVFLTLGIVRNDAEQGLLQPLVVRPVGRTRLLVARFLGSSAVCVVYVLAVYAATVAITSWAGGWTPDRLVAPGLELALGVVVVAAISTLGSVFLTATANGIGVLMIFGAGLVAGLLGQIGDAIDSERLQRIAEISSWVVPFEALYQDGLNRLTSDTYGFTRFALQLGPFGGSQPAGGFLFPWVAAYLVAVAALAAFAFSRRDL